METVFSKIIKGEIPSYKIAENDYFLAILDIFPVAKGHVLLISKQATDKFYDLDTATLENALVFARPVARAIEKAFPCLRCGLVIAGLEVPHAHIHLMPLTKPEDLNLTNPKLSLSKEDFLAIQKAILEHI